MQKTQKWENLRLCFEISTDVNDPKYLLEIMREFQEQLADRLKGEGFRSLVYFDAVVETGREPADSYEGP